jgi:hypothetical protein
MPEEVALEEAVKAELIALEGKLESADYFTLLGVEVEADAETVKTAFYKLCLRVHPDRYFRKNLGDFKPRLEKIFKALSRAHQALTDPAKREAYLLANPTLRKPPPAPKRVPGARMTWQKKDLPLPLKTGK